MKIKTMVQFYHSNDRNKDLQSLGTIGELPNKDPYVLDDYSFQS